MASNNGVEQVRDLRDTVHICWRRAGSPIIDEVHMLDRGVQRAACRPLEESRWRT